MEGAKRHHRNCVLVLLTLSALSAVSVFGRVVSEPIREKARFDVRGRPSSERIILKLTRDAGRRLSDARAALRTAGPAPFESALRQDTQDALQQWNSQRIRRAYPFKFAHSELAAEFGLDRYYVVDVPRGTDTTVMAEQFGQLGGDIESAAVSTIGGISQTIPNDPDFPLQYGMNNTGQTYGPFGEFGTFDSDIDAPEAWEIHTGRPGTVTLAIIDSGVGPHPDLDDRMVPGANMQEPTRCDGGPFDGLPCFSDEDCSGFVCSPSRLTIDENGHGTQVAGVAAATGNNGIGIAGVTWGANIMPIRVVDAGGGGEPVHAFSGLVWAVDHGAQVCNLSLQYFGITVPDTEMFQAAVDYAHANNVLVVAAAGNAGVLGVPVPGSLTHILTVSATNDLDIFVAGLGFGPEVDVSAPGETIYSTLPPDIYGYNSGTSFSSPHVAGLAALIKSYAFYLTNDEIADIIKSTADDKGDVGRDDLYGYGRINAGAALAAVVPSIAIVAADPPDGSIDARQPSQPNGSDPNGWDSVELTFDEETAGLLASDFTISVDPPGTAPGIQMLTTNGNTVTLKLDSVIPVVAWTTITHNGSNTSVRLGYLPADVNNDRLSSSADILALIDAINEVGDPLQIWQTDINRSGVVTPSDILRVIDLLNGADAYDTFITASLPE